MNLSVLPSYFLFLCQWTPMHMAAEKGYCEHILEYVVGKIDINIKDSNGVSTVSLYYCTTKNSSLRLLLQDMSLCDVVSVLF